MFPRENRIRTSQDILLVLRKGRRCATQVVTCSFMRKPATLNRITVIASTKVSKKATERNLAKRRVRAILADTPLPSGDLVVQLRKGATETSFTELQKQVSQCLTKLT